ncbi:MAG: DUF4340 domain-containing protein [bacterium]
MKIKKEYIILTAIIAALSIYLLKRQNSNMHYSLPELEKISKKNITKIIITKADSEITLLKKGDKWVITPQNFPANNDAAGEMEDEISSLTITDLVSESKNDILYDLNKEKRIEVSVYKGDELLRKIEIGKLASSYRHTFLKVEKDDRVFHAQGDLASTFNKTVSDLRDKTVMAFESEEITEVLLTKGNKKLTIVKSSVPDSIDLNKEKTETKQKILQRWVTNNGESVNETEIEEIIKTLSNLMCDSFVEDKTKNDFKNPVFSISLKGVKEYSISLFEKTDDKYPAISSETEYPFHISEWSAERFMKELETLKKN